MLESADGTETVADAVNTAEGIKLLPPVQTNGQEEEGEGEEEVVVVGQHQHQHQHHHLTAVAAAVAQDEGGAVTYIQVDTSTAQGEEMAENLLHVSK